MAGMNGPKSKKYFLQHIPDAFTVRTGKFKVAPNG